MAERVSLAQETLRRAAVRDSLTGLLNHREFYRRLTDEIARAEREQSPLSVLMLDLDNFKGVNDSYGHLRGDTVLREVASVITRSVREEDVVARYAGDEFSVILPGAVEADAVRIAERLRTGCEGVMQAAELDGNDELTLSIGVVTRRPGEYTSNYTVELADMALYRAKETGRDRIEVAGQSLVL
jgi:diguanylate cyclase (GGDEF)-like protein